MTFHSLHHPIIFEAYFFTLYAHFPRSDMMMLENHENQWLGREKGQNILSDNEIANYKGAGRVSYIDKAFLAMRLR